MKNDRIVENGSLGKKNEREEEPSNGLTRRGKRGEMSSNGERGKAADEGAEEVEERGDIAPEAR